MKVKLPRKEDYPAYVAAEEKLFGLQHRWVEARNRREELLRGRTPNVPEDVSAAAARVLEDGGAIATMPARPDYDSELEKLAHEIAVLAEAIRLQEGIVKNEQRQASLNAHEIVARFHCRMVRERRELVKALAESNSRELELIHQIGLAGFRWMGRSMPFMAGSINADEPSSQSAMYLRECDEYFPET